MSKLRNYKVAAVVVTYNRKELLRECLQALLVQTRPLDEIIVIDNASIDGTDQIVPIEFSQVTYVRLPENIGGAGGFHEGMRLAYEKGHDWIWVMDDDVIPSPDALESLLLVSIEGEQIGLLCSHVVWRDGSPHIMNVPQVSALISYRGNHLIPFNQHVERGLIRIRACSFVSALVSKHALEIVGLPIKEMFIYGDDIEFTTRLCKQFACYYVVRSKVLHNTKDNRGVDLMMVSSDQLWRYFYEVRNMTYLHRKRGIMSLVGFCLAHWPLYLRKALKRRQGRLRAINICLKGLLFGLTFRPRIEFPKNILRGKD